MEVFDACEALQLGADRGQAARGSEDRVHREGGSPQQNPFVERFNRTMRDEVLNGEEFDSLLEARVVISEWLVEYNTLRPHRGLGTMTPAAFAARWNAGGRSRFLA
jgi:transposase InsO family protein